MFCHLNWVHMLASMDRHMRHTHRQNHNHHNHCKAQTGCALLFVLVSVRLSQVVDMMLHGDHGSALRRRQRRLRSW